jgi:hypothetical protein
VRLACRATRESSARDKLQCSLLLVREVSKRKSLQISVVIGVRNGGEQIVKTIRSVCAQRNVVLECIVVDDGSSDNTAERIAVLCAADQRVRLFRQRASGLTRALITGCAEARAPLIARIDAGDLMLAGRLERQCAVLNDHPWIHVLSSQFRECGPDDAILSHGPGEQVGQITDLTEQQRSAKVGSLSGIAHICVCFRTATYRRSGGYRPQFALAQDVDLWARMAQFGAIARLEEVLTVSWVNVNGLSPNHHRTQLRLREIATAAVEVRARGGDEQALLREALLVSHTALNGEGGARGAAAYYVASRLAHAGDPIAALALYRLAVQLEPISPRHLVGYLLASLRHVAFRKE